jgi:hypothetical protein
MPASGRLEPRRALQVAISSEDGFLPAPRGLLVVGNFNSRPTTSKGVLALWKRQSELIDLVLELCTNSAVDAFGFIQLEIRGALKAAAGQPPAQAGRDLPLGITRRRIALPNPVSGTLPALSSTLPALPRYTPCPLVGA